MIGATLREIRVHLEQLASDDGSYYLRCCRTGDRPIPAGDLRFESRLSARAAAIAVEQYRAALRRYDPRLPYYDVVACEADEAVVPPTAAPESQPSVEGQGPTSDDDDDLPPATEPLCQGPFDVPTNGRSALVECCHRVAAAVFEALSEAGHDAVESAVLEAYVELAETVADPDELCCRLLECMAIAVQRELDPDEQAAVVADAAERSPVAAPSERPIVAALERLRARGVVAEYTRASEPTGSPDGSGAGPIAVTVSGYALSVHDGRLPVLPIAVELCRQLPRRRPVGLEVDDVDGGWRFELRLANGSAPRGLASAPVRRGV